MRKLPLAASAVLIVLAFATLANAAKNRTVIYKPRPAEAGPVFVVVDFPRAGGLAQPAAVKIDWGRVQRSFIAVPYGKCDEISPSGFVIKLKQFGDGPLKLTTAGMIIHGPYQGDPPLELLHVCYRVQK
jgi:hypothetical protein